MDLFVDLITLDGGYVAAKVPRWCRAGVGSVVPFACRVAVRTGNPLCSNLAVYHVEESRYLDWPGFSEACVRDFDTVVVVGCDDPSLYDGRGVEGHFLISDGMTRRAYFEAEARLKAYENGSDRRAG